MSYPSFTQIDYPIRLLNIRIILTDPNTDEIEKFKRIYFECTHNTKPDQSNIRIKKLSIDEIELAVLRHFDITHDLLNKKTRKCEIVWARQTAHYLAWKYTNDQIGVIGSFFGGKDHSTVLNSVKQVKQLLESDKYFKAKHESFILSVELKKD